MVLYRFGILNSFFLRFEEELMKPVELVIAAAICLTLRQAICGITIMLVKRNILVCISRI